MSSSARTRRTPRRRAASPPDERFAAVVEEMMRRYAVPGAAAAVVRDQEAVWAAGFGVADIDSGKAPTPETVFRCASVTKPFTATAVMKLRDEGKLSLDDPLVEHVPEFRAVANPFGPIEDITLRRLITHHSGLQSEAPFDYWDTLEFPSTGEIVESLPRARVAIPPDSAFKYCNLGFIMLGEVVARRSGVPYDRYVSESILGPLGMGMSGYVPTRRMLDALATGYEPDPHSDRPTVAPHTSLNGRMPAGGLYSTAADLARWLSLQLRTGRARDRRAQVIAGRTLAEMQRPIYMSPSWDTAYCVSWHAAVRPGGAVHYHAGGLPAYSTMTAFDAARKVGAAVLTNLGGHDGAKEAAMALVELAGAMAPGAARAAAGDGAAVAVPASLERYLGFYRGRGAQEAVIAWQGGRLMLMPPAPGAPSRFGPAGLVPGRTVDALTITEGRAAGEDAVFEFDSSGRAIAFRVAATVYRRYAPARG